MKYRVSGVYSMNKVFNDTSNNKWEIVQNPIPNISC